MVESPDRWWRRRLTGFLEPLRQRFERNRASHTPLRRQLNQAQIGITYDDYLTRVAVGAVGGAIFIFLLSFVALESVAFLTGASVMREIVSVGVALAIGATTGLLTWYIGYTRPRRVAKRRARKLNAVLPSTVTYMYALANGGLDAIEIVRRTARREETYGEQAREMQTVMNDIEFGGSDFVTALDNAAKLTPCRATREFLSDMVGVLESGGDIEAFLDDRRSDLVEELDSEQESYLEQIELLAEMYVSLLVAGPLFLIILLLVIGVLGSETLGVVYIVIYAGLPLGTLFTVLGLDLLDSPFSETGTTQSSDTDRAVPDNEDAQTYAKRKRRHKSIARLKQPLRRFFHSPTTSLFLTVPLAVLGVLAAATLGPVDPSIEAFRSQRFVATGLFGVLPFLVVTVPLAFFYEVNRRDIEQTRKRFPDALSSIARANRSGISTAKAMKMEAARSTGSLQRELEKVHNDMKWFHDPSEAFRRLAERTRMPMMERTMRLLAEANEASGNLHRTLTVAADEAHFQRQFAETRAREVASYVAVAVISFLVFLGIVLLLQQFYLEQIIETGAKAAESGIQPEMPGSLQNIDAEGFRLAFLHSALVQGACIGLVAGKLSRGTVLAGIKYSIGMVVVSFVLFGVV